jgi:hypothetical protein
MGWSQDFGVLRINTAVDDNPISLGGSRYDYGFGTHANSRIRLAVKGLRAFRARVALDDEKKASPYGSVIIRIEGDGKELFRSSIITMKTRPIDVDIDIHGVQELSLITEDAGRGLNDNFNCDDHVSWADPVVY